MCGFYEGAYFKIDSVRVAKHHHYMGYRRVFAHTFRILALVVALGMSGATVAQPAHALDKRVKLVFKTAAYGAGAGFLAGGAVWAMGIGGLDNYRNLFIGTSLGLYAGLALGVFVVATPPEPRAPIKGNNPYAPKRPVGSDDWMNEDEEIEEYKRESRIHTTMPLVAQRDPVLDSRQSLSLSARGNDKPVFWMPLAQVIF